MSARCGLEVSVTEWCQCGEQRMKGTEWSGSCVGRWVCVCVRAAEWISCTGHFPRPFVSVQFACPLFSPSSPSPPRLRSLILGLPALIDLFLLCARRVFSPCFYHHRKYPVSPRFLLAALSSPGKIMSFPLLNGKRNGNTLLVWHEICFISSLHVSVWYQLVSEGFMPFLFPTIVFFWMRMCFTASYITLLNDSAQFCCFNNPIAITACCVVDLW